MIQDPTRCGTLVLERRVLVQELRAEHDPIARGLLRYQIAEIDRELVRDYGARFSEET